MARLESIDGTNWEAFLASPVSVLTLARGDCPACAEWKIELEDFLANDTRYSDVRFGRMVLDRGGLSAFKRAHDWVADLRGLPYTLVSFAGEPVKDFVDADLARMTEALDSRTGI